MLRVLTLSTLFPDATRPNFGIFVERQTRGLAELPDVEVCVVAPIGLPPGPLAWMQPYRGLARLPERETWRGLDVHRPRFRSIPGLGGALHPQMLAKVLIPLLGQIKAEFPFDILDAEFFFPDGPAAAVLSRALDVPFSIKARGADIHHWGRADATRRAVHDAGCAANLMLAVSEAMRTDMAAIGLPAERIRVHRTGVDLEAFAPRDRVAAKRALDVEGPLVVALGALIERKGHAIVIEAVTRLPDVTLLIAGQGPGEAKLRALASRLGVADRVRVLGPIPHAELPALLGAADVMALATVSEGIANAWVETLASGAALVTTDVGGVSELLTDPRAGRLAARTPDAFAEAIAALLADPPPLALCRAMAEPFTWEANTTALRRYFGELTGK